MSTYQIEWHWYHVGSWQSQSFEVNLPPALIGAQVSCYGMSGGGLHHSGIQSYRKRLSSGADENHDFGAWPTWPPVIADYISSITFAATNGKDQETYLCARMDYWS